MGCSLWALLVAWTLKQGGYQDYTVRTFDDEEEHDTALVCAWYSHTGTHMSCAPFWLVLPYIQ